MEDMEGRKSKVFSVFQKLITFEVYFPVITFVSTQRTEALRISLFPEH
jgi:hypothetical protein